MNNLRNVISIKKEKLKLLKKNNEGNHIFLTIIENKNIFQNYENKILGLMIFNLCQDSLTAARIGNNNLVYHYKERIKNIENKINNKLMVKLGIDAIIFPMFSYCEYKKENFNDAEKYMINAITSLKTLFGLLEEKSLAPLLEQYKNMILIYFKNNEWQKGINVLKYLLNDFKNEEVFNKKTIEYFSTKREKVLFNGIIDEILLKNYSSIKENHKEKFNEIIDILRLSKLFSKERHLLDKFINKKLHIEDSSKIIEADLPPTIEGIILKSILNYSKEQKELLNNYFIETYNINISL